MIKIIWRPKTVIQIQDTQGGPGGYGNKMTSNRGRGRGEDLGHSHISDPEAGKSMVELRKTGV